MGRYSDSEEERRKSKKKKKKRSRSRSRSRTPDSSRHSSKHKKSKKSKHKKRSRSHSSEKSYVSSSSTSRGRHKSRSRSWDRHSRRRSRSRDRDRRSRSRSRERGRRSRSFDRRSRSSSRSRDRGRKSRKERRSRSRSSERFSSRRSPSSDRRTSQKTSKSPPKQTEKQEANLTATIPGFDEMTPSEQAKVRLQLALKAAAAADEKIREQLHGNEGVSSSQFASHYDAEKFANAVRDVESDAFVPSTFKSNRSTKTKDDKGGGMSGHELAMFGTASARLELRTEPAKPFFVEPDSYAHPNLYCDPEEKMDRWMQKLNMMRRKKLEGVALVQ